MVAVFSSETSDSAIALLAKDAKLEAVRALLAGTLTVNTGLTGLATDSKLESVLTALGPLATDSKLEAVRALLAAPLTVNTGLTGLATDSKLESVLTALGLLATDSKLEAVRALLAAPLTVNTGLTGLATDSKLESVRVLSNDVKALLARGQQNAANSLPVVVATGQTLPVSGTVTTNPTLATRTVAAGQIAIGTTATALPSASAREISLQWASANSGIIYVGVADTVTATNAGYEMDANNRVAIFNCNANLNEYWAIASAAGQNLRWVAS